MSSTTRTLKAVLCAGSVAALWASATAAGPTGSQLAETVGHALVGERAPALVVHTIDGKWIDLSTLYDKKAVYLKFWATWCAECLRQMPSFEHTYETAGPGLAVIAVNTGFNDSLANVRLIIRKDGLKMPMVIDDGKLAAAFHLRYTPQHVVIGRGGRIEYVGYRADARLDAALRAAPLAAPDVGARRTEASTSPSFGRYGIGDPMPDLAATTLGGSRFRTLDEHERRVTVLVFLSPWCESYFSRQHGQAPPRPALATNCRKVREQVTSLANRDDRARWIGVASGLWSSQNELRTYQTKYAPGIPLMFDESGEWFHTFGVMHTPTIVIANPAGRIVRRIEGFDSRLNVEIEDALAS